MLGQDRAGMQSQHKKATSNARQNSTRNRTPHPYQIQYSTRNQPNSQQVRDNDQHQQDNRPKQDNQQVKATITALQQLQSVTEMLGQIKDRLEAVERTVGGGNLSST